MFFRMIPPSERTAHTMLGEYFMSGHASEGGPGFKFKILENGETTNGTYFQLLDRTTGDCGVGDDSGCGMTKCSPPYHTHLRQYEVFEILNGEFQFILEGNVHRAVKGEKVVVPPNAKHTFCRGPSMKDHEELQTRISLYPALNAGEFFPNIVGIFNDAGQNPNPLKVVWLMCHHHIRLVDIPGPVHEAMCVMLSFFGPLLGFRIVDATYAVEPSGGGVPDEEYIQKTAGMA
mmetsp:Transcript_26875/g.52439  ORF Transcript_26875/g.52439 Transcript_26875/m.52439 type:complete len:232 (+) Transcript_26875:109-804(+)